MNFDLYSFLMALAGFLVHFLASWGEFWRAKDTPRIGLIPYLTLDAPAWGASFLSTLICYFAGPEVAQLLGYQVTEVSPGLAALIGFTASSAGPKVLGIVMSRAGVR